MGAGVVKSETKFTKEAQRHRETRNRKNKNLSVTLWWMFGRVISNR